jgi:transcription initiation factor TFIIIB Brf1 subunit/transcription initiation factor TFIIB
MHNQADLNNKMRSILVDWLVEVHHKMKLQTSTLWLTVNLIDRFLTTVNIKRAKLQLVGIAAFFIACKFEEVYAPEAKDFIHITDNAYTREELLKMETDILTALNFEVLVPTGYHFLSRYLNAISASENTRLLASYYAERNLQEPHMLEVKPRVFAGAAVYCALLQQNQRYPGNLGGTETWNRVLREESNLTTADIMGCAENLIKNVKEEPITTSKRKLIAAKKKYLLDKNKKVAELELPII